MLCGIAGDIVTHITRYSPSATLRNIANDIASDIVSDIVSSITSPIPRSSSHGIELVEGFGVLCLMLHTTYS